MQRHLNTLFIWVLIGVLFAGYLYQYIENEKPCSLCLLQRLAMIGVAVSLLLNLRFGIKVQHYGLALLSCLFGTAVSLRQIGLHICLTFPTFGTPVFGLNLYVWSFIVFFCSIFACAILIILDGYTHHKEEVPHFSLLEKATFGFLVFFTLANAITTFLDCGLTFCL